MKLNINFKLNNTEEEKLALITKCDGKNLEKQLALCGKAALQEYVEMFLGKDVPSRASEIYAHRLFLLIKNGFCETMPDEDTVGNMFQTSARTSVSLIRAAATRYQYELEKIVIESIENLLEDAEYDEDFGRYILTTNNQFLIEHMNAVIAHINVMKAKELKELNREPSNNQKEKRNKEEKRPYLSNIKKLKGIAARYDIASKTYEKLKDISDIRIRALGIEKIKH